MIENLFNTIIHRTRVDQWIHIASTYSFTKIRRFVLAPFASCLPLHSHILILPRWKDEAKPLKKGRQSGRGKSRWRETTCGSMSRMDRSMVLQLRLLFLLCPLSPHYGGLDRPAALSLKDLWREGTAFTQFSNICGFLPPFPCNGCFLWSRKVAKWQSHVLCH